MKTKDQINVLNTKLETMDILTTKLTNEIKAIELELERVRTIASWHDSRRFIEAFFRHRNDMTNGRYKFKTDADCFYFLNDQFNELTGTDRYEFESFQVIKNKRA